MYPFIPNSQSALQLVINLSNILGTYLELTSSTDAQNTLLRSFRPRPSFCCLKPWNEEQPVLKLYPEGNRRKPNRRKHFICCQRKESPMWETDGGICSWCDLLGKPECGVTGKSSLSLTKMPDISFHKRREVHCSMIQLHPRCRLGGGVVRWGEPWHSESRDGAASTGSTTTWLCDLE